MVLGTFYCRAMRDHHRSVGAQPPIFNFTWFFINIVAPQRQILEDAFWVLVEVLFAVRRRAAVLQDDFELLIAGIGKIAEISISAFFPLIS